MNFNQLLCVAACACLALPVWAHVESSTFRPESHAPAGVMSDHLHAKGEWMFGYRYLTSEYRGLYQGSSSITPEQAGAAGYSMVGRSMSMDMHMLDIMYAVSDRVTLMFMPMHMSMDMTMEGTGAMPMEGMHGMADDMGADMMGGHMMGDQMMGSMTHSHGTSGWGDTNISALIRLHGSDGHNLHLTLGISAPTGSVDEKKPNGMFEHYGMQLGSGTWDLVPNLTYTGYRDRVSWGAQIGGTERLESANDSGFAFGDQRFATGWLGYRVAPWLSATVRLEYEYEDQLSGEYNGAYPRKSPGDDVANYGGEFMTAGIGFNAVAQRGPLAGMRLGLEWESRVDESYNGIQLGAEDGWNLSLSYAF